MKLSNIIASVCIVAAGALVYANSAIPYGNHILIAYDLKSRDGLLGYVAYNKYFSRAYLAIAGVACTYTTNDLTEVLDREDAVYQAVPASLVFYDLYGRGLDPKSIGDYDRYVSKVIAHCDGEARLHDNAPPPIIYAILTGRIQYVAQLAAKGVALDFRLDRPGKDSDKMGPKEYAKYLELKFQSSKESTDYKEIYEYLNGL